MFLWAYVDVAYAQLQTAPSNAHIVSCTGIGNENGGIPCNWCTFVQMIGNIVQYFIYLAVLLTAIMFSYSGFLFLTNNGNNNKVKSALNVFRRTMFGIIGVLAAWLIVNAIMTNVANGLGYEGDWNKIVGCEQADTQVGGEIPGLNSGSPNNFDVPTDELSNVPDVQNADSGDTNNSAVNELRNLFENFQNDPRGQGDVTGDRNGFVTGGGF